MACRNCSKFRAICKGTARCVTTEGSTGSPDLGCRCALAASSSSCCSPPHSLSLSLVLSPSPPSPVAAYPRGPYLACVQSDGMLGKQQSIHGDADAYATHGSRQWSPSYNSGPRRIDRAQSKSRVTAKKCEKR